MARTNAQYQQVRVDFQMEWDDKLTKNQQELEKKGRQIMDLPADTKDDVRQALNKERDALAEGWDQTAGGSADGAVG